MFENAKESRSENLVPNQHDSIDPFYFFVVWVLSPLFFMLRPWNKKVDDGACPHFSIFTDNG